AHRSSAHPLDESVRDFDADVGVQQVAPDFRESLVHVLLGEHAPTRNPLQDGGELLRKGRKHKPRKLVSELTESKWGNYRRGGNYRPARLIRIAGTFFQPTQRRGASASRTTGTPLTRSCLISERRPRLPARRLAQARTSPLANRAAAARSSQPVYQTSASPPAALPAWSTT